MELKESGEMYLETIYILSKELDNVRSLDVARYMKFSKPSVSRAMGLLRNSRYIAVDEKGYIGTGDRREDLRETCRIDSAPYRHRCKPGDCL